MKKNIMKLETASPLQREGRSLNKPLRHWAQLKAVEVLVEKSRVASESKVK